jgi:hypothetical protein
MKNRNTTYMARLLSTPVSMGCSENSNVSLIHQLNFSCLKTMVHVDGDLFLIGSTDFHCKSSVEVQEPSHSINFKVILLSP